MIFRVEGKRSQGPNEEERKSAARRAATRGWAGAEVFSLMRVAKVTGKEECKSKGNTKRQTKHKGQAEA